MIELTIPRLGADRSDKQYRMQQPRRVRRAAGVRLGLAGVVGRAVGRDRDRGVAWRVDASSEILPDRAGAERLHRGRGEAGLRRRAMGHRSHPARAPTWCGWPRSACNTAARASGMSAYAPHICAGQVGLLGHGLEEIAMSTRAVGSPPPPPPPPPGRAKATCARVLGVPSLVLFGLVYMVPLTVFTTYGIVTQTYRRPAVGGVPGDAGRDGVHRSGRTRGWPPHTRWPVRRTHTRNEAFGRTDRLPGRLVARCWITCFLPMLNYLVIGIYMSAAIPAVPRVGFIADRDRRRDGAQHRRHRLGGAGQLPDHRAADRLHRRVRRDGVRDDLGQRQRRPDGAASPATAPSTG